MTTDAPTTSVPLSADQVASYASKMGNGPQPGAQPSSMLSSTDVQSYLSKLAGSGTGTSSSINTHASSSWDAFDQATKVEPKPVDIFADTPEAQAARETSAFHLGNALESLGKAGADVGTKIDQDFYTRAQSIVSGVQKAAGNLEEGTVAGGVKAVVNAGVNAAGQVAGGALDIIKEPLNAFIQAVGDKAGDAKGLQALAGSKPVSDFLDALNGLVSKGRDFYDGFKKDNPEAASVLENAANIAGAIGGGEAPTGAAGLAERAAGPIKTATEAVQAGAKGVAEGMGTAVENAVSVPAEIASKVVGMGAKTPEQVNASAVDSYTKAIKPTISGKGDAGAVEAYNGRVIQALNSIHENKAGLELTDADGNLIKGETPKTVGQLSDAIAQTKADIYKRYDAMAQAAGESGAKVDLKPMASELDSVINSKALSIKDPAIIDYAKTLQARLIKEGALDAGTTQELVTSYNNSLKAYYRNPSYETATRAAVDALVANRLRESLDATIEGATGPGYQTLKNQYGALKTIEADVSKRSQVIARQSTPGFAGNLSNIASGAELVRGLITMNPTDLAVSGTIKGIQLFTKWRNNPDRLISGIFDSLDKAKSTTAPFSGTTPSGIKYRIEHQ